MSVISQHVQEGKDKAQTKAEKKKIPLQLMRSNIKNIKAYCHEKNQDWVFMVVGAEGSGKSTLAGHIAAELDPSYNVSESMIYTFKGDDHSYTGFLTEFQDTPWKVTNFDEAVTALFSRNSNSRNVKEAIELFKINRDCKHFNILVAPSFWDLDKDLRERRTKTLLYTYVEIEHLPKGRKRYHHKYAYFSGEKIIKLSHNKKARIAFRSAKELFRVVRPDYIETFPGMPPEMEGEYLKNKRAFRRKRISEISNGDPVTVGTNKLLKPDTLKFTQSAAWVAEREQELGIRRDN
ncbi:MAG: hypothetical protein KAR39_13165 [Thermoplasmata archaeon]|nr:hypothetical protein [Thermoplasmata archaeon]